MKLIKFRYRDSMSSWEWRNQECAVPTIEECKRIYGLDEGDCDYEIISIEEI